MGGLLADGGEILGFDEDGSVFVGDDEVDFGEALLGPGVKPELMTNLRNLLRLAGAVISNSWIFYEKRSSYEAKIQNRAPLVNSLGLTLQFSGLSSAQIISWRATVEDVRTFYLENITDGMLKAQNPD